MLLSSVAGEALYSNLGANKDEQRIQALLTNRCGDRASGTKYVKIRSKLRRRKRGVITCNKLNKLEGSGTAEVEPREGGRGKQIETEGESKNS